MMKAESRRATRSPYGSIGFVIGEFERYSAQVLVQKVLMASNLHRSWETNSPSQGSNPRPMAPSRPACGRGVGSAARLPAPDTPQTWLHRHWFIRQMPSQVQRQFVDCLVATRSVFFQGLHDNPVQVSAERVTEHRRVDLTVSCELDTVLARQAPQTRTGGHKILFVANGPEVVWPALTRGVTLEW